ncbi:MAG: hypothetical protein RQ982_12995 [Gammaproteobacteria bacterium]|nr:hypothetical protein [Gammaproteobacteria bacterium]
MSRKIEADKMEVARRQINSSIKFLFNNEDPIPIHTIISAGLRILRDIAKHKNISYEGLIDQVIKPHLRKQFWSSINTTANFFKHADKDPDGVLGGVDEELNDALILISITYYEYLNKDISSEMKAFKVWFMMSNPHFFPDDINDLIENFGLKNFTLMSREEKLNKGQDVIQASKNLRN